MTMASQDDRKPANGLFSVATDLRVRLIRLTPEGCLPCAGWIEGRLVEIGGDGATIAASEQFQEGDLVCIALLVPDTDEELRLYGRVAGALRSERATEVRASFIGIAEGERSAILRYAYRLQIKAAVEAGSVNFADH